MKRSTMRASQSGLTLIELMIAMMLLSLLVVGIYTGIVNAVRLNYVSAQRMAAVGVGRERLEQMRGMAYSQVNPSNYPTEAVTLTHLGGSRRLPILAERSSVIRDLPNPPRKAVEVSVAWEFRDRAMVERLNGCIFLKNETVAPGMRGDVSGFLRINPNNSPHSLFSLTLPDGSAIDRADLTHHFPGYNGPASAILLRPMGDGSQNTMMFNGEPYPLQNSNTYRILSDSMTLDLYNDHVNPGGLAVGRWHIAITATDAQLTVVQEGEE